MASSDIIGTIEVNPQQEGYFVPTEGDVERTIQINFEGKKAGEIVISTHFKLIH